MRWREDRAENLIAASHAREDVVRTRAAVDGQGRILALELEIVEDFGAYCFYPANYLARVVAMILTGPYRVPNYAYDIKVALTNKCGNGPMRAPMAITSWVMEGTIEAIARRLSLDPIEVRRVNMLGPADLPYPMLTGLLLEDVTPRETLERALATFDMAAFRARQAGDRVRGIYRGVGLCCVVESTTYGSAFYKAAGIPGLRPRVRLGQDRALGCGERLRRSDGFGAGIRDNVCPGGRGAARGRSERGADSPRQYRHRALTAWAAAARAAAQPAVACC